MRSLSRRQFTHSVGASLLLSPILSMLDPRRAQAAPAKQAKRILFFCTMGTHTDLWSPTGSENSFTMSNMLKPLEAVKGNLVLVEGLPASNPGDGHGSPEGLCARGNGYYAINNVAQKKISADEFISQGLIKAGVARPIPSLLLGADTTGGQTMLWKNDQAASVIASPSSAYTTVFGNAMPGTTTTKPDALLARRKSILDTIMKECNDVKSIGGASEQTKLQDHIDSIRQLETKLMSTSGGGGGGGVTCTMPGTKPVDSKGQYPGCANDLLHLDIIVNAFACDITRVAAIQFGTDQAFQVDIPGLQGEQHNGFLHGSPTDFSKLIAFEQWLSTQFANLITTMKSRPAPDDMNKTLLDDTLLVWCRDMGEAATTHNMNSMRFVLAGGTGGYLKTNAGGRYLDLRNASSTAGANRHERVLLNCCEAMGLTSYAGFGDPMLATKTPLPNISG
jgi:uncharacterized protein DUF1552